MLKLTLSLLFNIEFINPQIIHHLHFTFSLSSAKDPVNSAIQLFQHYIGFTIRRVMQRLNGTVQVNTDNINCRER